jgi:Flp pilus assembly pilin Flp
MMSQMAANGAKSMKQWLKSLCLNERGQDMIEYALLAATLVVVVAGCLPPTVMPAVSSIFSKITGMFSGV